MMFILYHKIVDLFPIYALVKCCRYSPSVSLVSPFPSNVGSKIVPAILPPISVASLSMSSFTWRLSSWRCSSCLRRWIKVVRLLVLGTGRREDFDSSSEESPVVDDILVASRSVMSDLPAASCTFGKASLLFLRLSILLSIRSECHAKKANLSNINLCGSMRTSKCP